jgi:hypothetical protein
MSIAALDPTIPRVLNVLIMDSEGKRIAVKYYSPEWCVVDEQQGRELLACARAGARPCSRARACPSSRGVVLGRQLLEPRVWSSKLLAAHTQR